MMMILGGGMLGYWYFKSHPEKIKTVKRIGRGTSRKVSSKLSLET